jgi:limonene 1,2-monooxygenase
MDTVYLEHGVFIAPYHDLDESPAIGLRQDLELVEWVDKLGFTQAWFGEHHSTGWEIISSPELMIAAAAENTKRIRLGAGVVSVPYHNPLMVVNRILQLDHMTMGRVMFGIGPGLLPTDALMVGIDIKAQREMMVEAIEVILPLLKGEEVTVKGSWFNLVRAQAHLRPYTKPYPEIAVASAVTPSGGMLAGRFGFGMLCVAAAVREGFDSLAENWKVANQIAGENGRRMDPAKLRLVMPMYVAESREQARADVRQGLAKWLEYFSKAGPRGLGEVAGGDPAELMVKADRAVIGTPDDAIAAIERLHKKQGDFGVILNQAVNWAPWAETKRSYELYARYVMPYFAKVNENRRRSFDRMGAEFAATEAERKVSMDLAFARWDEKNR